MDRHKVGFIATTQPIDTSTLPGVENNVITGRKFIRVVLSALLKYSAVNDAGGDTGGTGSAAGQQDNPVGRWHGPGG